MVASSVTIPSSGRRARRANARVLAAVTAVIAVAALTACTSSKTSKTSGSESSGVSAGGGSAFPGGTSPKGKTILMTIYTKPLAAWTPTLNAAKSVEAATGVKVDVQYANGDDQTEIQEIQAGISRHVAAMALQIDTSAVASAVCDAAKAGIPVVAWNNNALTGDQRSCVQATIAQDEVAAGQKIGQYMIDNAHLGQGAHIFCPVEVPTAVYAVQRAKGINEALNAIGAKCDVLATGTTDSDAKTKMVQYLLGHRDTNAVIAMGGVPLANAPAALKQVGVKLPVAGFDVFDPRIPQAIKAGDIVAAVDQQFYTEAFGATMQLALELQYGLYPSDMGTGGRGVIDKSNVDTVIEMAGTYR
jgi:simple sugar transport system substrate-binding protein